MLFVLVLFLRALFFCSIIFSFRLFLYSNLTVFILFSSFLFFKQFSTSCFLFPYDSCKDLVDQLLEMNLFFFISFLFHFLFSMSIFFSLFSFIPSFYYNLFLFLLSFYSFHQQLNRDAFYGKYFAVQCPDSLTYALRVVQMMFLSFGFFFFCFFLKSQVSSRECVEVCNERNERTLRKTLRMTSTQQRRSHLFG